MSLAYKSPDWGTHKEVKRRVISYPFRGDPRYGYEVKRFYEGPYNTYEALDLDAEDEEFSGAYMVKQSPLDTLDGDLISYSRIFASIPVVRVGFELYPLVVPGLVGGSYSMEASKTVTNVLVASWGADGARLTVASHGYSQGDKVRVNLDWQGGNTFMGYRPYKEVGIREVLQVIDTDHFVVRTDYPDDIFQSGTVAKVTGELPGRSARAQTATADVRYDYFLPGVSNEIASPRDIPVPDKQVWLDGSGQEVDTLTTTTQPTKAEYSASVGAGESFVVEATLHPYIGNIWERITKYVRYQ